MMMMMMMTMTMTMTMTMKMKKKKMMMMMMTTMTMTMLHCISWLPFLAKSRHLLIPRLAQSVCFQKLRIFSQDSFRALCLWVYLMLRLGWGCSWGLAGCPSASQRSIGWLNSIDIVMCIAWSILILNLAGKMSDKKSLKQFRASLCLACEVTRIKVFRGAQAWFLIESWR